MNRQEALQKIAALAAEHNLSADDIAHALSTSPSSPKEKSGIAMRLFSYLGGTLIFAGIAAYIAMFWDGMSSLTRVLITFGPGFACYLMAVSAMRDKPQYTKIVAPLLLIAGFLQPGGIYVAIHEWFDNGGDWRYASLFVSGVMFVQQFFTFRALPHAILLFFAVLHGILFAGTVMDLMDINENWIGIILGNSLLCISHAVDKASYRRMSGLGYLIGAAMFLIGLFDLLENTPIELLFLAASGFMIYLSIALRRTELLIAGVISMLSYIAYFTAEHFANSVGWPVTLIILGLAFFGISTGGWKIKRKYISS